MSGPATPAAVGTGGKILARPRSRASSPASWWPLFAIVALGAVLRLGTLGSQSFWYDEAFTPVHVLRAGLGATLHNVVHTENTPPLWYLLEWGISRVLGTGVVALRMLSALAGIATVLVAWAIGSELAGRRAAIATAALVASSPLLVWYSQEARAYGLFVLLASVALLCFIRALHEPTTGRLAAFSLSASLALLTHYFFVFLLVGMVLWLLGSAVAAASGRGGKSQERTTNPPNLRRVLCAVALPLLVGAALIPLILAQGGHGTQWIGEWALGSRLEAIPQYYLTGYTGAALGHGVELLVAVVMLGGFSHGLWCTLTRREERGALIALTISAAGVLIPIALAVLGADYLAPRNLVAAMVPVSALLAIVIAARRTGRLGMGLAALLALGFTALTVDVALSPRLQRGDWKGVAAALRAAQPEHVITTVELGAAPLEYYLPPLSNLAQGSKVRVTEIDETGYAPLRKSAGLPPAPGFHLSERLDIHGLIVYRFTSRAPVTISEAVLREHVITDAHPEVLVPGSPRKTI
ncbi:MAG TPA: glycosyltransferase family 39 protein [Solirubrobacteraceae bacterium]|jgi:mannosyltransferase|nr:glycosyltransferase family 39 protein [Solirubrobacteraceae bacterium]